MRNTYFDFLRRLAILFVIGIHTYPVNDGVVGEILIRQTLQCAVPLFLAVSGYFIGRKQLDTWPQYFHFLKKQLPRFTFEEVKMW